MQNPIKKFRQNSIVFEKPSISSETLKTFDDLQLTETLIIFVEILHTYLTYQYPQKGVWDFLNFI